MTDNEIIKALECCGKNHILGKMSECKDCYLRNSTNCITELIYKSLDLITRQKADYENLKAQEEKAHQYCKNVCEPKYKAEIDRLKEKDETRHKVYMTKCEELEIAKAEVIKEFAERLKEKAHTTPVFDSYCSKTYMGNVLKVYVADIDNLVKEMVGDGDDT